MSGILGLSRKKAIALCIVVLLLPTFFTKFWYVTTILLCFGCIIIYINSKVKRLVYGDLFSFSPRRPIKKYTTMVIGDCCSESSYLPYCGAKDEVITIMSPHRSLKASYQILLHTFSILNEGSTCIVVCKKDALDKDINIFDVPYLNIITQKELSAESLRSKLAYPIIYSPIMALKKLINLKSAYHKDTCPDKDIVDFCKSHGLKLIYMTNK